MVRADRGSIVRTLDEIALPMSWHRRSPISGGRSWMLRRRARVDDSIVICRSAFLVEPQGIIETTCGKESYVRTAIPRAFYRFWRPDYMHRINTLIVDVYKSPTCGCCSEGDDCLKANEFTARSQPPRREFRAGALRIFEQSPVGNVQK